MGDTGAAAAAGEEAYVDRVGPVRAIDAHQPLEFSFAPVTQDMTDLNECYLRLTLCVRRNGTDTAILESLTPAQTLDPETDVNWTAASGAGKPGVDSKLSVCNNFFHSLFTQVSVYANEILLENQTSYAYTAYIQNLLSWDREAKESVLPALVGWVSDDAGLYDSATNSAVRKRQSAMLMNSKKIHFKARLNLGVFDMQGAARLLPNHVSLKLVLRRNPDAFVLHWLGTQDARAALTGEHTIDIESATCEVRRVKIPPTRLREMESRLSKQMFAYPFQRSQLKTFNFNADQSQLEVSNDI